MAELRPLDRRRRPSPAELVARHRGMPAVDRAGMPHEADELFGTEVRVQDESPASRGG